MKICRFAGNRIGRIENDRVIPIENLDKLLPLQSWPPEQGDQMIASFDAVLSAAGAATGIGLPIDQIKLDCPVASPSKVIAAPLNYSAHTDEVGRDPEIHANTHSNLFDGFATPIAKLGLFLKANTSLAGVSQPFVLTHPDRRTDHEAELCAVIGERCRNVAPERALDVVAAWTIGLDMTVRGTEDRSFRKSPDGYTILGPWLVTPDEIQDPSDLELWLDVNGVRRQRARTSQLTVGVSELIALASQWYTLCPGDIVMTGTPDGVGPVGSGDRIDVGIEGLGRMRIDVLDEPVRAVAAMP